MDIKKLTQEVLLKNMTPEQQMAVLDSVQASVKEAKAVQKQKIAENVDLVLQALKRIEADMIKRVDGSAQVVENRVKTIKDGKDGKNGADGKQGKDGKDGKNGVDGRNGKDGINGVSGERGQDGVGVQDAHIDFDGSLIITLTDGTKINTGEVLPLDAAEKLKVYFNNPSVSGSSLPDQSGNSGKYLTTNGTTASWGTVSGSSGGTVTSIAVSGGTTGLTTSGGPVTSSGTITLAGTLAVANGGTGSTTASGARTNLGLVIGTDVLAPNGSAASLTSFPTFNQNTTGTAANITATSNSTLTTLSVLSLPYSQLSGTVPTWNQNTTGTASNVTGTVATTNGGTNLTTYATGDIIYASAANTLSKLAAGTNGYVLTLASGVPTWAASTGGVTSITGTASQITASASTGAITLSLPSTINVNTSGNATTATSATTTTNIAGGTNLQIPYNTGAGATSFITAPTVDATYLKYNTSGGFSWATVSGGGGTPGGSSGQLQYNNSSAFGGVTNITVPSGQTAAKVLPRVSAVSTISAVSFNTDNYDLYIITAQSAALSFTSTTVTGTPSNGQRIWISVTGTAAVALTFGAGFEPSGTVPLPTTTQGTVRLDIGFVWNVATSAWRCIASA
jgi:hypothetical protein